jgi:hypothetical protein
MRLRVTVPRKSRGRAGRRLRLMAVGTIWAIALSAVGIGSLVTRQPAIAVMASGGMPRDGETTMLFVGNSFTTQNGMPLMLARLADAARERRRLYVYVQAPGGASLFDHATGPETPRLIGAWDWDYVVLQEQSEIPGRPELRAFMLGSGRGLERMIERSGAQTVLYATWGYERGAAGGDSFAAMEARTEAGYRALAQQLAPALTVAAGRAFAEALRLRPGLRLWGADGMHPSRAGSYLAACAFYRAIYHRRASGNSYTADIDARTARLLQQAADTSA